MRQSREEAIRTVICVGCGLAYANPQLDDEEIASLYTTFYRDTERIPEQHFNEKEVQSRERISWLMRRYRRDHASVLEIGCSEGVLLRQMRDGLHWSVAGFEPFRPYALHGIHNWGLDIETSFFSGAQCSRRFNIVTFMHVIEHIPDPITFLRDVGGVLEKDGHIFFETPNLWRPKVGRISAALFASPHLAIFSPKSVALLLEKSGFELIELEANLNLRVLARWRGDKPQKSFEAESSSAFLHAIVVAFQYRCWRLLEQSLFLRRRVESFLVRAGKRLLSHEVYERIRRHYR
jgi:2-polyprenyl-3-methyl-5-hydroxy-6-metoxy-1,4-benzoquinol methylase